METLDGARLLIYSHDTFGLGHLRRCQLIANTLVHEFKGLSVLIISGSPIIGQFDLNARVDYVRVPGVIKRYNGEYVSLGLHIDVTQTMEIRSQIIANTAKSFRPDVFLADKEPLGLRGEIAETLQVLAQQGARRVLGVRDILDGPDILRHEWELHGKVDAVRDLYDEIWVYGPEALYNPFEGLDVGPETKAKMSYTGYLRRVLPQALKVPPSTESSAPYLLVTAGGGGDGFEMFDAVIRAYESHAQIPLRPVFVLGPFMPAEEQEALRSRIEGIPNAEVIAYETHLEFLIDGAAAVVSMCGYNAFCECLSFNKPTLFVPREQPRQEQLIRAREAERLGLSSLLTLEASKNTQTVVRRLQELAAQQPPAEAGADGLLDGLPKVVELARRQFALSGHAPKAISEPEKEVPLVQAGE